jgi:DNA invertase Pin-like site-specific DNA recombinase
MKGVIWVRVSSADQAGGYSPDAQLRLLREAAQRKSIEVVREFNVSESAKTSEARKQFRELIQFIVEYKPDVLIAYAIDRITRNPEDLNTIHNLIQKGGLSVFIVDQNKIISKNSDPMEKFTFLMFGNIAYFDNMRRAASTKMGMLEKARGGIYPSRAPLGYLNVPDQADPAGGRRTIAVDPVRAPLVRLAFDLYAQGGHSLATLRDELNRRGLRQKPTAKNPNAPMSVYGLHVILKNPLYCGSIRWAKQTWRGTHEPLVSADLFNRVQARLRENCSYAQPALKKNFAFKKFLRCGYCHGSITAEEKSGANKSGHYVYYKCVRYKNPNCPQTIFREEEIDRMFAENLGKLYIDKAIAEKIREGLKKSHTDQQASDKRERQRLRSEETRKTNHINLLYQDRLDGTITKEQYLERQAAIQLELRSIQADVEKLGRHNARYREEGSAIIDLLKGFKETYLAADLEGKAEILGAVVDRANLRNADLFVTWKKPFDILFILGEGVLETRLGVP